MAALDSKKLAPVVGTGVHQVSEVDLIDTIMGAVKEEDKAKKQEEDGDGENPLSNEGAERDNSLFDNSDLQGSSALKPEDIIGEQDQENDMRK